MTYSYRSVKRLIGLPEPGMAEHVTLIDLLSWTEDPGGDPVWRNIDEGNWMALRGPLAPDSAAACVVWDFKRAMKRLELQEQAVIALVTMGFSLYEVARILDVRKRDVREVLLGPRNGATGRHGAVSRLTAAMNGHGELPTPVGKRLLREWDLEATSEAT